MLSRLSCKSSKVASFLVDGKKTAAQFKRIIRERTRGLKLWKKPRH